MFEKETQEVIQKRMNEQAASQINVDEGSMFYVATAPMAVELMQAYFNLERVLELGFAETSKGAYLDMRAREHGVERKLKAKAVGKLRIEGTQGTSIPNGSVFSTKDGRAYTTVEPHEISETFIEVAIIASDYGTLYNTEANTITELPISIAGVTHISNPFAVVNGSNEESDAALLERLLSHVRKPATSGNVYQYKQWAESLLGVGGVKVLPLWNGPGTVKIIIVDDEMLPADEDLINTVSKFVEEQRPIGAHVTYVSAQGVDINIEAIISLINGHTIEGVRAQFDSNLEQYLKNEVAFEEDSKSNPIQVSIAKIGSILIETEGIEDYKDLKINGASNSVTLNLEEVPVGGVVNIHE